MALVTHRYGSSLQVYYYPLAGDEDAVLDSLISARLYGPNQEPTEEQLEDEDQLSTGHIGSRVTEWELVNDEGTGAAGYRIVFPALPLSLAVSDDADKYVVALNYRAEAGGPELQDTERFFVYRPDGLTSKIRVTAQDVYGLESRLKNVGKNQLWLEEKIDAAIENIIARLKARGYAKRNLVDLGELNAAARRLACAYACRDLISDGDPSWSEKHGLWMEEAEFFFNIAQVGVTSGTTDDPAAQQKAQKGGAVAFLR